MEELVKYIVTALADYKDEVEVSTEGENIKVVVKKADMGRIIGKEGRIAKAIRSIVRSVGQKNGQKMGVEIIEKD